MIGLIKRAAERRARNGIDAVTTYVGSALDIVKVVRERDLAWAEVKRLRRILAVNGVVAMGCGTALAIDAHGLTGLVLVVVCSVFGVGVAALIDEARR